MFFSDVLPTTFRQNGLKNAAKKHTGLPVIIASYTSLTIIMITAIIVLQELYLKSFFHHVFLNSVVLLKLDQGCHSVKQRIAHALRSSQLPQHLFFA